MNTWCWSQKIKIFKIKDSFFQLKTKIPYFQKWKGWIDWQDEFSRKQFGFENKQTVLGKETHKQDTFAGIYQLVSLKGKKKQY